VTTYTQIEYGVADGVATITLNRPDRLNAFTTTMARELVAAFDATDADDEVRVVLLTGAGRGFCAGADLSDGAVTFDATRKAVQRADFGTVDGVPRDGGGYVSLRIAASRKPVIVAVNGPAVGVGATMILPADIRLASDTARFGFVFARRGLVPEAASSWFLPRVVGISQAMEWVATGRVFNRPASASAELLAVGYGIAAEIARNTSAVSVALSRRMMWSMLGAATPWEAHRIDSRAIFRLGRGPDAAEGVMSFLEKRPPKFAGQVADYTDVLLDWPSRPEDMT